MRFEEQVKVLCAQALAAQDEAEVRRLLAELRLVLHQRIEELRAGLLSAYSASVRRSIVFEVGPHLRDEEPGSIAGKDATDTWRGAIVELAEASR